MCQRKATTEKTPIAPGLLREAKLHFQRKIKQIETWHNIPDELAYSQFRSNTVILHL